MAEKTRYSDAELEEFRATILFRYVRPYLFIVMNDGIRCLLFTNNYMQKYNFSVTKAPDWCVFWYFCIKYNYEM